jgi:hypothetical protein
MGDRLMADFNRLKDLEAAFNRLAGDLEGYFGQPSGTFQQTNSTLDSVWPQTKDPAAAAYQGKAAAFVPLATPLIDDARNIARFIHQFVDNAQTTQQDIIANIR